MALTNGFPQGGDIELKQIEPRVVYTSGNGLLDMLVRGSGVVRPETLTKTIPVQQEEKQQELVQPSTEHKTVHKRIILPEKNKLFHYKPDESSAVFDKPLKESILDILSQDEGVREGFINKAYKSLLKSHYWSLTESQLKKISLNMIEGVRASVPNGGVLIPIDWVAANSEGSFTKRIQKVFYKKYDIKLLSKTLEDIGNIIAKSATAIAAQDYYFDITQTFNWKAGDFGDHGSCFWGGGASGHARKNMEKTDKFYAIRVFKKLSTPKEIKSAVATGASIYYRNDDENYCFRGAGRAWMYKGTYSRNVNKVLTVNSDLYVIFNGYGLTTGKIAQMLASHSKLGSKVIQLSNEGWTDGGLYLNRGIGYIMGDRAIVDEVNSLDFAKHDKDLKNVF